MFGVSIRNRLGVPATFRAMPSREEALSFVRAPGSKTRLKEPEIHGDPLFDPYKEPTRWKKELEERGITSEIRPSRKAGVNPVLVYRIH